jgi:hypothetical protein
MLRARLNYTIDTMSAMNPCKILQKHVEHHFTAGFEKSNIINHRSSFK